MMVARAPAINISAEAPAELLAPTKELLRRAILTLAAVPDPDIRFRLGVRTAWPPIVQLARDAYGSAPPKVRMFQPTARDLSVYLDVLSWLERYEAIWGPANVRLFVAWVFGAAMWSLQERCSTNRRRPASPKTVYNRIDHVVNFIAADNQERIVKELLDGLHEFHDNSHLDAHGGEIASTDARDLPKSRPAWNAPAEAQTPAEEKRALKDLIKRLEKNRLNALRRKQQAAAKAKDTAP